MSRLEDTPSFALDLPNDALAEYQAPPNFPAGGCPLCKSGMPITSF